jgi:ferritin-like metal-binding protein YciE
MAKMTDMKELLTHELGDLLYAERRFVTATRKLSREAGEPQLRQRLEKHLKETERHVERLEKAFDAIGVKAKAEKCEAAIGLKEEHDAFKKEEKPSKDVLQAFDLGSGLRIEHYEIAAYKSAIALARALGEHECATILAESLAEEEQMAQFLEEFAPKALEMLIHDG